MYYFLLALCLSLYSSSASTTLGKSDGTCVNPTTLSFIENSLTNLSMSDSINSVTSLFQLSLLKEMVGSCKEKSCKDNEKGLALLKRIELTLNTSTADIKTITTSNAVTDARLSAIESQLASLQLQLSTLTQLLSKHVNITLDDAEEAPSSPLLSSCKAILDKWPNSPSGYYSLADVNGHTRHVYCHMETLCGKGGGWRRIASLNMKNSDEKCPTQFRLYSQGGVRACGRPVTSSGGCVSINFPSRDIKYSQVCGKVIGYQYHTTDGPAAYHTGRDINSPYIDGIILTHGNPRRHIWSLASGGHDDGSHNYCPCGSTDPRAVPSFVGSDYYCEAGHRATRTHTGVFYTYDSLWDGKDCGRSETDCCKRPLIPWFYKSLTHSTTNAIEMRVCCDEGTSNEDVSFEQYEIYVK